MRLAMASRSPTGSGFLPGHAHHPEMLWFALLAGDLMPELLNRRG
jgi:hypothetical protein